MMRNKRREQGLQIKISGPYVKVDNAIDRILEIYKCSVSPIRNGDRGGCYVFLTVIGEVEE